MKKKLFIVWLIVSNILLCSYIINDIFNIIKFNSILSKYNMGEANIYYIQKGYVPDEDTAKKIATAIFTQYYGNRMEEREPLIAIYDERYKVWYVRGTIPPDTMGGVPSIIIRKSDGRIYTATYQK